MMIEGFRQLSSRKKWTTLVLAFLPIAVAATITTIHFLPPSAPSIPTAYFFDEATGQVSVRPSSELPPLPGANGEPTVVRAIFLTPSDADHKSLGYLEKYDDATLGKLRNSSNTGMPSFLNPPTDVLVRLPKDGSPWVSAKSPEGSRLLYKAYHPEPNGEALRVCPP